MTRFRATLLALGLLAAAGTSLFAMDPPHNISVANSYGTLNYCSACHKVMGGASGATLTVVAGNTNLCLSCHVSGGSATNFAFTATDQALPTWGLPAGVAPTGTSHRWDSGPQGHITFKGGATTASTGTLKPSGVFSGAYPTTIEIKITVAGNAGTAQFQWRSTSVTGAWGTVSTNVATATTPVAIPGMGVSVAFANGTGTSFQLNDVWHLYIRSDLRAATNAAMAPRLENGAIMCSTCHDQHLQANTPFDPTAVQTYTKGAANSNRHFQRVANDTNAMCGDCHAARNVGVGAGSHPVGVVVSGTNLQAPAAPLVVRTDNKVQCLTCHDVHKSATNDGSLLRVSYQTSGGNPLCMNCHTLADKTTPAAHFNTTTGVLWPGDQWGGPASTYPAITDTTLRGACKNCHNPHGWPDASAPVNSYPKLLVAREDNLCETCHDATGPATKDIRTEITKPIHHPVERTSGRTVACGDCHNPHMANTGVHTYSTTADANRNRLRADAGGVLNNAYALRGVDGVAINYTGLAMWTAPAAGNFTKIASGSPNVAASGATYEYQVCFKCHTSYSFGSTPPSGITSGGLALVNGSTQPWVTGAGTATFQSGSTNVTGSGTGWTTASMYYAYIRPTGSTSTNYRVNSVGGATSLSLSSSFNQTTVTSTYEVRDSAAITNTNTVTGYSTNWTSALVNQFFAMTSGNTNSYQITAVPSATTLTIASATTSTTPSDFYIHPGASFTSGSTAVVGYGTAWTSSMAGNTIQANGQAGTYTVASVTDATHLTLSSNYTGTTGVYRYLLAGGLPETDLAMEFNPANRSGHPVVTGLSNYTGSSAPRALATGTMTAPWNINVGAQTMMCSDCHNTDGAAAQGPHGSANQFMLKGTNAANWPNVQLSAGTTSWCANCHTMNLNNNGVHTQGNHSGYQCYKCHVVIPHGSKRSRLIGDRTNMPARYAYNNDLTNMEIMSFTKGNPSTSYSEGNCGVATCYSGHTLTTGEAW